jgi:hypothetical protein
MVEKSLACPKGTGSGCCNGREVQEPMVLYHESTIASSSAVQLENPICPLQTVTKMCLRRIFLHAASGNPQSHVLREAFRR